MSGYAHGRAEIHISMVINTKNTAGMTSKIDDSDAHRETKRCLKPGKGGAYIYK